MGDRFHHVSVPLSHSADDGSPRKETGMFVCMFLPVTKRKYFTLPRGQFTNNECMPSKPFAAFLYFLYKRPLLTQPVQCKQWRVFHFDLTTPTQHHASISTAVMSLLKWGPLPYIPKWYLISIALDAVRSLISPSNHITLQFL